LPKRKKIDLTVLRGSTLKLVGPVPAADSDRIPWVVSSPLVPDAPEMKTSTSKNS
jgi:hypothetical protein